MIIRDELDGDSAGVRRVEELAFDRVDEPRLVDQLRAAGKVTLSMVAVEGDEIIGHVLYSPGWLDNDEKRLEILALGPVAVVPERQGQGVGSALMTASLERLRRTGYPAVFCLGHASYYPRFGFERTDTRGILCEFAVPPEAFMLVELHRGALDGWKGTMHYQPEFNGV